MASSSSSLIEEGTLNSFENSHFTSPPSSPPSFHYSTPDKSDHQLKRLSNSSSKSRMLASLTATQALIDSANYPILDDSELEVFKRKYSHLSFKCQLQNQRLNTEIKVRDAILSVSRFDHNAIDNSSLSSTSDKIDEIERNLSRYRGLLIEIQRRLLEHNAGVLAKYVNNKIKIPTSPINSLSFDGRHFHANNDNAFIPSTLTKAHHKSTDYQNLENQLSSLINELGNEREQIQALSIQNEQLRSEFSHLEQRFKQTDENNQGKHSEVTNKLEEAQSEIIRYQELLTSTNEDKERQISHYKSINDSIQKRLDSVLEDFSQIVTTRDEITDCLDRLGSMLEFNGISYTKSSSNPVEMFNSITENLEIQLQRVKENNGLNEQMQYMTDEKQILRNRFDDNVNQIQSLSNSLSTQKIEFEKEKQTFLSINSDKEERISQLEEELNNSYTRNKQLEADYTFYKDSNASYERELKNKEVEFKSPISDDEEKASSNAVRAIWNVLPISTHRNSNEKLLENNSPKTSTLSQNDIDKLKLVLKRSTERNFESFDLQKFMTRIKILIEDDKFFIEKIIHNAETANLYKGNAEKAHKLALDFKGALEAYKKQVIELQTNLSQAAQKDNELRKERDSLREQVSSLERESSKKYSNEVDKLRKSLTTRDDELQAVKQSQMDKSLGMLDELNSLQMEVTDLRQKLRHRGG